MEWASDRAYKLLEVYSLTSYSGLEPVGLKNALMERWIDGEARAGLMLERLKMLKKSSEKVLTPPLRLGILGTHTE